MLNKFKTTLKVIAFVACIFILWEIYLHVRYPALTKKSDWRLAQMVFSYKIGKYKNSITYLVNPQNLTPRNSEGEHCIGIYGDSMFEGIKSNTNIIKETFSVLNSVQCFAQPGNNTWEQILVRKKNNDSCISVLSFYWSDDLLTNAISKIKNDKVVLDDLAYEFLFNKIATKNYWIKNSAIIQKYFLKYWAMYIRYSLYNESIVINKNKEALLAFKQECKNKNLILFHVLPRYFMQYSFLYNYFALGKTLNTIKSLPMLQTTFAKSTLKNKNYYNKDGVHFNTKGNKAVVNEIIAYLKKSQLMEN